MSFFSVHNVGFSVLGYPLSYLELIGTLFNIWAVWLMTKRSLWTWPVGIVAVLLFGALFYQIRLYSDLLEQAYYLLTNCWGWWLWSREASAPRGDNARGTAREENGFAPASRDKSLSVSSSTPRTLTGLAAGILAGSAGLGWAMARVHVWSPAWFPAPAAFPYLDALTSVMGLVAQMLAAYRKVENWHLWLIVNVISVGIYYQQGVRFVAVLYSFFFLLALKGLADWRRELAPPAPALAPEGVAILPP